MAGDTVLTAALVEQGGDPCKPHHHAPRARATGGGSTGPSPFVPAGMLADAVVVSARTDDGVGLFVVDPDRPGVSRRPQEATSRQIEAELELSGVVVGPDGVLVTGPARCRRAAVAARARRGRAVPVRGGRL